MVIEAGFPHSRLTPTLVRGLLVAALVAASALAVVLGVQTDWLRARNLELARANRSPRAGLFTPTFAARTLDGDAVTIGERADGGRQILLFFTTTCPYCEASLPSWRALADTIARAPDLDAAVYGVALDSAHHAREYRRAHGLTFPVITLPSRKLRYLYRATSVPIALVLDHEGRIVYARTGAMTERAALDSLVAAARWRPDSTPEVRAARRLRSASSVRP